MRMIPCDVTSACTVASEFPTAYKLSNSFTGSMAGAVVLFGRALPATQ